MKSMTGFGRGECLAAGLRYSVEISTVNRRNAEIVINLPREFSSLENIVRETVAASLIRGRATVTVSISGGASAQPGLDSQHFQRLHSELTRIQRQLKIPDAPTLSDVIRLHAATARESAPLVAPDPDALRRTVRAALRSLENMRSREGTHLARELTRLLNRFIKETTAIIKLAPGVTAAHRTAMRARLAALDPAFAADDDRLARELAFFADRSDITEELSRLDSHNAQFRAALEAKDSNGRTLDFLAQEMFRECNTIGSKANSAAITRRIVAAKTELERIREQVQNAE